MKNSIKTTKIILFILLFSVTLFAQKQPLLQLRYKQNYTPTYNEVIEMYELLDSHYTNAQLIKQGQTDVGKPLHLFVINNEEEFNPAQIKAAGKSILLINNGIHPGESCGIDASLEFADDLLRNKNGLQEILKNTVIIIIPAYNIGGLLNRSAFNRANQTTPYETGFRGNAANYDLNRDFVKCDSENAKSFTKIFQEWDPDVFLDTHTTNGSIHQYSVTLLPPQPNVFPPVMENFLRSKMLPGLYEKMAEGDYELTPYVSWMYRDPKMGIKMTHESPRYSSGYARLFHSYGMMTENHVYKNYPDRVKSCYQFITTLTEFTSNNSAEIISSRKKGISESLLQKNYPITYRLDSTQFSEITFKGYEIDEQQISPLSGLKRFGYDQTKPYTQKVRFYDTYLQDETVKVPDFYIVPQAYKKVVELLNLNNIIYQTLQKDTLIKVYVDYIEDFSNPPNPYNGHFFHETVTTRTELQTIQFYAGDLMVSTNQKNRNYLIECLEPKAEDSFFRWNFFDNILDRREYFSSYGFDENAIKYLNDHPEFKQQFLAKVKSDTTFAGDHIAQLSYIYYNSEWAEKSYKRYPIGKIFTRNEF